MNNVRSRTVQPLLRALIALLLLALLIGSTSVQAETPGRDGNLTVSGSVVVNQYAPISGTATIGQTSITGVGISTAMPGLAAGDLVLIYQAQGATINSANSASYGAITNYNSAGRYEFQTVASVSGNTVFFATYSGSCNGLRYSYTSAGKAQIIRVPQFRNLTVNVGGVISAAPWNGTTGGVVAFTVSVNFAHNGTVNAGAAGFRGGNVEQLTSYEIVDYLTVLADNGAEKGESIAGFRTDYPGGAYYGRGAPANGGGGGNAHNAGGGGGANGDNGNTWAGQGRPDTSNTNWVTAWNLDPSLNSSTNNSGGGRGGYSFAFGQGNVLVNGPGNGWDGDRRREVGGLGGRPLAFDRTGRVFFGGGGGAGDSNNNSGGGGGRGGGLVFVRAAAISGSGTITASGAVGISTINSGNDAPGGGGGGGTIIVQGASAGSLTLVANGGTGGNQIIGNAENEGPGGGGGGGVISAQGGVRTANGGNNGLSDSTTVASFRPNGATRGATGNPNSTVLSTAETPFCTAPPITSTKSSTVYASTGIYRFAIPDSEILYTISVRNPGAATDAATVFVTDILPSELVFYNGDIDDAGPLTGPIGFIDGPVSSGLTCCTSTQIAYSAQSSGTDFTYVPIAGFDPAVRRIRVSFTQAFAPGSITASSFQLQLRARVR